MSNLCEIANLANVRFTSQMTTCVTVITINVYNSEVNIVSRKLFLVTPLKVTLTDALWRDSTWRYNEVTLCLLSHYHFDTSLLGDNKSFCLWRVIYRKISKRWSDECHHVTSLRRYLVTNRNAFHII